MVINCFDASEHLKAVLSEIRDQIDWVGGIWQKKSYHKNPMAQEDKDELANLVKIGLIDELIEFKPNYTKYAREQECDKRNMGIEYAKQKGCNFVMSTDADEYYDADQFRAAKKLINENGYTNTYCSYVNYYKDFFHYLVYPFRPLVPFIHHTFFNYKYQGSAPGPTDPTRRIDNPLNIGTYMFPDEDLRMHHAAWIRKDIRKKLINWSAKDHFNPKLIEEATERWKNWKEGQDAVMLFNVPKHSVKVKKLEKPMSKFTVPWEREIA